MSRLVIIHKVLELVWPLLELEISKDSYPNSTISGVLDCQKGLKKLHEFDLFTDIIENLESDFGFFKFGGDDAILKRDDATKIVNTVYNIRKSMFLWEDNLLSLAPEEQVNSVALKLPKNIQFDVLSEFFKDLNKVLNQLLVNETIQGKIEFRGFESGSSWVNVGLGTGTALMLLCNVVNLIYNSKERQQKIEAQSLLLDEMRMTLDAKDKILSVWREEMDKSHQQELQKIREESQFPETDYEMPRRLDYAIQGLEKWINLGLEIHPSLAETKEIQMSFPDTKNFFESIKVLNTESPIKLLAPGNDETEI
ncbi:MAG: hypothetical protein WBB82_06320 [Limnothrix sp.]